jgi:uncharacterized protein (TIGR01777 family)
MDHVLVTGGTGLIGSHLCNKLQDKGYSVSVLSRRGICEGDFPIHHWDVDKGIIEEEGLKKANYIIHLAGANIAEKRWTNSRKKAIIDSRVESTRLLHKKMKEFDTNIKAFICSSSIGFYGAITSNQIFSEMDSAADDFVGKTCKDWEDACMDFKNDNIRTVSIRTGVVLTKNGGALAKMKPSIKFGIGSPIGGGNQYIPGIHIDDLCDIYIKALEDQQMSGAYNGVAPEHITNKEFISEFAKVLKKPLWFPKIPGVIIKLLYGEMSQLILKGSRISSDKIIDAGFKFSYPKLTDSLRQLCSSS